MEQPQIDQSLSVERLTPADLIAAAQAVATILAFRHASAPSAFPLSPEYPNFLAPGQIPFNLTVRWEVYTAGEQWVIALRDATVGLDYAAATAEAERLPQPILQLMRPRALSHFFRSRVDELTPGQPSWQNEKGSNDRPSPIVACATGCRLPEITKPMARASLNLPSPLSQKL